MNYYNNLVGHCGLFCALKYILARCSEPIKKTKIAYIVYVASQSELETIQVFAPFSFLLDWKRCHLQIHCAKSQIFGPEFARIRIGARRVYRNVLTYSITADSKYTWNILLESGLFFRIQIEHSKCSIGHTGHVLVD